MCNLNDNKFGYIVVNGKFLLNGSLSQIHPQDPPNRGVNTMILNPTKCTASEWHQFDTWASIDNTNALIDYLNYLADGTVILMVSFDESFIFLAPAAKLLTLMTDVDIFGMGYGSKYVAVIQKASPQKTAIVTSPGNCISPELAVRVEGRLG